MRGMKLLLSALVLAVPMTAMAAPKQCGESTCGTPTKTTKTINGVVHNCTSTTCTKSCCTLGDPPVCSNEKTTTSDCSPARVIMPGKRPDMHRAPSATIRER